MQPFKRAWIKQHDNGHHLPNTCKTRYFWHWPKFFSLKIKQSSLDPGFSHQNEKIYGITGSNGQFICIYQLFIHSIKLSHDLLRAPLTPILMQGGGSQIKAKNALFHFFSLMGPDKCLILVSFAMTIYMGGECSSPLPMGVWKGL